MDKQRHQRIVDSFVAGPKGGGVRQRVSWDSLEQALKNLPGGLGRSERLEGVQADEYGLTITIGKMGDEHDAR